MARVRVPQSEGFIQLFDGAVSTPYRVKDGVIDVPDDHVTAILASVPDATLFVEPESPAKPTKPEAPAKEK